MSKVSSDPHDPRCGTLRGLKAGGWNICPERKIAKATFEQALQGFDVEVTIVLNEHNVVTFCHQIKFEQMCGHVGQMYASQDLKKHVSFYFEVDWKSPYTVETFFAVRDTRFFNDETESTKLINLIAQNVGLQIIQLIQPYLN